MKPIFTFRLLCIPRYVHTIPHKTEVVNTFYCIFTWYIKQLKGTNLFYCRGKIHMTHSAYVKMWKRISDALAAVDSQNLRIRELTAHSFRHNYCSSLCYQIPTISIKRIAQLMGDTEAVVMKVYNHIILEKENASNAVENALAPSNKNLTLGFKNGFI